MPSHDTPYIASSVSDAKAICSIYTLCFGATLGLASVRTMLSSKNNFAFLGSCDERGSPSGFIFCRVIGNESELLWLGVIPSLRRRGGAQVLMAAAIEEARVRGSEAMLLEVAESNEPALVLYKRFGFVTVGRRSRYYKAASGEKVDAKIMRLPLKSLMRAVRK